LITHGFPAPENLQIAREIEAAVREQGAVPATIAILGGEIMVGLTSDQLDYLASATNARKCSRRDLPLAVARREDGATTVAGTMIVAHWAGIEIFATGGIGGVHRGHPFDESADLMELARTPVTVVCAGAKAILDLPLTLEVLETQGVPVIGYQTDELPAFYSRSSGLPVDLRVDSPAEIVDIIRARRALGLAVGTLVTAPVPAADEWPAEEAQQIISQALADADASGISGKAITPYLLGRVNVLSGSRSKAANIALLLNNARLGGQVAKALSK
jgi:pseudouridine-5'-phosphate glycosidase